MLFDMNFLVEDGGDDYSVWVRVHDCASNVITKCRIICDKFVTSD